MNIRNWISAAAIALLPLAADAAQRVIPVAGSTDGANGSKWQSDLTVHNASARQITFVMRYHVGKNATQAMTFRVEPHKTTTFNDVVFQTFVRTGTIGAITIDLTDADSSRLVTTSRTYNRQGNGEFGQDIPAIDVSNAAGKGDLSVLVGPSRANEQRFNFGAYALEASRVRWELVRTSGVNTASTEVDYAAGEHVQYNNGIATLFGASPSDNDAIRVTVLGGRAVFYGSTVNQQTGDPSFVPAILAQDVFPVSFQGIDVDEDGTVDIGDANGDGVLDAPIEVVTSMFPAYFRIVATGETGAEATYEILSAPAGGANLIDAFGTIQLGAPGDLRGKTGEVRIRATADGQTSVLVIPVLFK